MKKITYGELVRAFRQFNREHDQQKEFIVGHIVFTEDSFCEPYSEQSRTYEVTSQNKAYMTNMGGYSIFGGCLDGKDPCARLDCLMEAEKGGTGGWKVDYCYLVNR